MSIINPNPIPIPIDPDDVLDRPVTTFFDEMVAAIENYPAVDIDIDIVEVSVPGDVLNVSEIASFRVRVTNNGPLNLTGVTLRVAGLNGATVANNGAAAPFVNEFVTQELPTIRGDGGTELTVGSPLKFKAPALAVADASTLVKVTLEAWTANFDRILKAHTKPTNAASATDGSAVTAS
jgi:hypothetical protein